MVTREELNKAKEEELTALRDYIKEGMVKLEEYIDKRLKSAYINSYDFTLDFSNSCGLWYFLGDKHYAELMEVLNKYTDTYKVIVDYNVKESMWYNKEVTFKINDTPGLEIIEKKVEEKVEASYKKAEGSSSSQITKMSKKWWEFWK